MSNQDENNLQNDKNELDNKSTSPDSISNNDVQTPSETSNGPSETSNGPSETPSETSNEPSAQPSEITNEPSAQPSEVTKPDTGVNNKVEDVKVDNEPSNEANASNVNGSKNTANTSKAPKVPPKAPPKKAENKVEDAKVEGKVETANSVDNNVATPNKADAGTPAKKPSAPPKAPPKKVEKEVGSENKAQVPNKGNTNAPSDKPAKPSAPPKAPPKKADGAKLDNKGKVPPIPVKKDKDDKKADKLNTDKERPLKDDGKQLKKDNADKLKDDKKDKKLDENAQNLSKAEIKALKKEEKERLKRERQRIKEEQKNRKELNEETKREFGAGQALKGAGTGKNAKTGDINQKKKGKKKWLLLLLLLLLLLILIIFLVWGDEILNPQGEYRIDPTGNVVQIKPNVEGWALEDCRFMAGDTIYFVENLYLLMPRVNEDGDYNNMCAFRFRVLLETDEEVYSDCIDYINEKGNTSIKYYRGYWYYYGIILPDNQLREIVSSITFKRTLTNKIAGKRCTLRFDIETVYPSGEEIDNNFGACPGDWRFGIEEYYLELVAEGWR